MSDLSSSYVGNADPRIQPEYTGRLMDTLRSSWSPFGDSAHEYVWQDDALCDGMEEIFEVAFRGEPLTAGLNNEEIDQLNLDNYEFAKSICDGCPVRASCLSSADESDRYWTTRGGEMPTALSSKLEDGKRSKPPSFRYEDYKLWSCKKHDRKGVGLRTFRRKDGSSYVAPYCLACNLERQDPNRPR